MDHNQRDHITPTSTDAGSTPATLVSPTDTLETLQKIHTELVTLNSHNVFAFNKLVGRALVMQFLKGTFLALGSLVGAAIILSVLLYILSQMEVIPIVGEWIKQLNAFLKTHQ